MILNGLVHLVSSRNRHAALVLWLDSSTPFQPPLAGAGRDGHSDDDCVAKLQAGAPVEPRATNVPLLVGEMLVKYRVIPLIVTGGCTS